MWGIEHYVDGVAGGGIWEVCFGVLCEILGELKVHNVVPFEGEFIASSEVGAQSQIKAFANIQNHHIELDLIDDDDTQ